MRDSLPFREKNGGRLSGFAFLRDGGLRRLLYNGRLEAEKDLRNLSGAFFREKGNGRPRFCGKKRL